MIDLIGYWGGVSALTSFLILPILALIPVMGDKFIHNISKGEIESGFSDNVYNITVAYISVKGKRIFYVSDLLCFFTVMLSTSLILIVTAISFDKDITIIEVIAKLAVPLSTPSAYIIIFGLVYLVLAMMGEKCYELVKKINKLLAKVEEK